MNDIKELVGKTLVSVEQTIFNHEEALVFLTSEGRKYWMFHAQDCCEQVYIESITGELSDLVGTPILVAEESSNEQDTTMGSQTWTFYKFATRKGYVDIRWYGKSNGYYSESVSFVEINDLDG